MLASWRKRNIFFGVFVLLLLCETAVSTWLVTLVDLERSKDTNWTSQMTLGVSALTLLWTALHATSFLRRHTVMVVITICLTIVVSTCWFSLGIWTCIPAASCCRGSFCPFFKLLCGLTWIEMILLIVVSCYPPNFQIFWRQVHEKCGAGIVRLRRSRLKLRQRFGILQDIFPSTFRCGICMKDRRAFFAARFLPCRHPFCQDCVRGYVVSKLEERRLPILCPHCVTEPERPANKIGALNDFLLRRIKLSGDQTTLLSELELAKFSVLVDCPKCERSTYIIKGDYRDSNTISCPSPGCQYIWCKTCAWETEIDDAEARQHSCEGAIQLHSLMRSQGWNYCPGEDTLSDTERISGCNHMTCKVPGCSTHFCYPCGEAVPSSAFAEHKKRCPGSANNVLLAP